MPLLAGPDAGAGWGASCGGGGLRRDSALGLHRTGAVRARLREGHTHAH